MGCARTWLSIGVGLVSLSASSCAGLLCIACDGYLGVEGSVFRAPAGAPSTLTIDKAASASGTDPIAGCEIALEPWVPEKRPDAETVKRLTRHGTSGAAGQFNLGGTARPGNYDVTASVLCPGLGSVQRVFRHNHRQPHRAVVLIASGT